MGRGSLIGQRPQEEVACDRQLNQIKSGEAHSRMRKSASADQRVLGGGVKQERCPLLKA